MTKKILYCKHCGKKLSGLRRTFCGKKCNASWEREQYKMDFSYGHGFNDPVSPEQRQYIGTVEPLHVPYEILEQAKVYTDCQMGGYHHPLGHKTDDDWEEIKLALFELSIHFPKKYRSCK